MTKRHFILFLAALLVGVATWLATRQPASQPSPPREAVVQPVTTVRAEIVETKEIYKRLSKKEATEENIIDSIKTATSVPEIASALTVLIRDERMADNVPCAVVQDCFVRHNDANIRAKCREILLMKQDESDLRAELREAKNIYEILSKKEANEENIVESIKTATNVSEISWALTVLLRDKATARNLPADVFQDCIKRHNEGSIRAKCGEMLLMKQKELGITVLQKLVADKEAAITYRLSAGGLLADNGVLDGYPLVRNVILTGSKYESRAATDHLVKFLPYEGKALPDGTGVVDVEKVVKDASEEVRKLFEIYKVGRETRQQKTKNTTVPTAPADASDPKDK